MQQGVTGEWGLVVPSQEQRSKVSINNSEDVYSCIRMVNFVSVYSYNVYACILSYSNCIHCALFKLVTKLVTKVSVELSIKHSCLIHTQSQYSSVGPASQFFEECDIYWAPSSIVNELYEQLSRKKYREILRPQIQ